MVFLYVERFDELFSKDFLTFEIVLLQDLIIFSKGSGPSTRSKTEPLRPNDISDIASFAVTELCVTIQSAKNRIVTVASATEQQP